MVESSKSSLTGEEGAEHSGVEWNWIVFSGTRATNTCLVGLFCDKAWAELEPLCLPTCPSPPLSLGTSEWETSHWTAKMCSRLLPLTLGLKSVDWSDCQVLTLGSSVLEFLQCENYVLTKHAEPQNLRSDGVLRLQTPKVEMNKMCLLINSIFSGISIEETKIHL